jgi:hypothetical protein
MSGGSFIFIALAFVTFACFGHGGESDDYSESTSEEFTAYFPTQEEAPRQPASEDASNDEKTRQAIGSIFERIKTQKLGYAAAAQEADALLGSDEFNNPISKAELTSFRQAMRDLAPQNPSAENPPVVATPEEADRLAEILNKLPDLFKPLGDVLRTNNPYPSRPSGTSLAEWKKIMGLVR